MQSAHQNTNDVNIPQETEDCTPILKNPFVPIPDKFCVSLLLSSHKMSYQIALM